MPRDAYGDADSSIVVEAAQNLKQLSRASITPNKIAAHILANIQCYSQLVDLTVYGMHPEEHIWSMDPTSLTRLAWEIPNRYFQRYHNPWDAAYFLVDVVEATCPALESLDIFWSDRREDYPKSPVVPSERARQYQVQDVLDVSKLAHLRHFGFRYHHSPGDGSAIEPKFLHFIEKDKQTLKSVTISLSYGPWLKEQLNFILKVCGMLPDLNTFVWSPQWRVDWVK